MRQRNNFVHGQKMTYNEEEADKIVIKALDTFCEVDNAKIKRFRDLVSNKINYYLYFNLDNIEHILKLNRGVFFKLFRYGLTLKGYEVGSIKEIVADKVSYDIYYKLIFDKGNTRVRRK